MMGRSYFQRDALCCGIDGLAWMGREDLSLGKHNISCQYPVNLLIVMGGLYSYSFIFYKNLSSCYLVQVFGIKMQNMTKISASLRLLLLVNIDDKYGSHHIYDFMINYIGINRKCLAFHKRKQMENKWILCMQYRSKKEAMQYCIGVDTGSNPSLIFVGFWGWVNQ